MPRTIPRNNLLSTERQRLTLSGLRLARGIAAKAAARVRWLADDLESAAFLGLVRASHNWLPERGIPFLKYAYRSILGAVQDHLRDFMGRNKKATSKNRYRPPPVSIDDNKELRAVFASREESPWRAAEIRDSLDAALRGSSAKERRVLQLRFEDRTFREVSGILGVSHSCAVNIANTAMQRVRSKYGT